MLRKDLVTNVNSFNPPFLLVFILVFGLSLLYLGDIVVNKVHEQQFVYLAQSFLNGKLYFLNPLAQGYDATLVNGKYYWPEGPFPAVLLMPFVFLFGTPPLQGHLTFGLNILNLFLLFKIAQKLTNNTMNSLWLSLGYVFATAYLNVALHPNYSYFSQIIATTLLLLSIYEFFNRKRWLVIGILVGMAAATRFDLFAFSLFFTLIILTTKIAREIKFRQLITLYLPIASSLVLLFLYNYVRFGNITDQGYFSEAINPLLRSNLAAGLWSFTHFPANFYYLFLKGPEAVFIPNSHILKPPYIYAEPWGLSIFFTSPIFFWIFKNSFSKIIIKSAAITVLCILFLLLGYAGIGYIQVGFRYALDFYPLLFILLCYSLIKGISIKFKTLVVLSFLFNVYLVLISF